MASLARFWAVALIVGLLAAGYAAPAVAAGPLSIEAVQPNRNPAVISASYLSWFPLRIEGMEIGPLVYVIRVKNTSDSDLVVRAKVKSYRSGDTTKKGNTSARGDVKAGGTGKLAVKLMPPRKAGRYTAEIVLQTQERGLLGGVSPFRWKDATSTEVNFEVMGKDRLTVQAPNSLALGIIKAGKPPYMPTKDETVMLGINAVLEVLGASIPGYAAGTEAKLQPSLLAACVVLKNPKLDEAQGEKVLTLQARVLDAKTGSAQYPFYAPGFDRVIFTVELPDGASVPKQDHWLVEQREGVQVAIGIVDGVDKQIGRSKSFRQPSLQLRYSDSYVDGKYKLKVMAMGLVGPFGREVDDDELKEAAIWPDTPLLVKSRSRLGRSPWIYDYGLWQTQPERVVWYVMSASLPAKVNAKPSEDLPPRHNAKPSEKPLSRHSDTITNSIGMKLVYIPPTGPDGFLMGSPATEVRRSRDERQHRVILTRGFWMGTTEVIQKQWKAVMGNNPSCFKGDDLPVERVSWNDAVEFCEKLSLKEGKHYRLPTEAEWEYACRAGTTGPYAGTGRLEDMGWYRDNSNRRTHPVGTKKANAWGLYDMHGNVWEWCNDWYDDYPAGTVTDPPGPRTGTCRVLRGGAWSSNATGCETGSRFNYSPSLVSSNVGFRCARIPE